MELFANLAAWGFIFFIVYSTTIGRYVFDMVTEGSDVDSSDSEYGPHIDATTGSLENYSRYESWIVPLS